MKEYKLVFEETFNVDGDLNKNNWNHEVGTKWANNESQCYVDDLEHCFIKDGKLVLKATIHENEPCKYRSARVNTYGKKEFTYGKFVFRAKMPKGKGAWPALWFMGNISTNRVGWPLCGEIDLLEFAGNRPGKVTCAIHTATYNHKIKTDKGTTYKLPDASEQFHDYILIWTKEHLQFFVDDVKIFQVDKEKGDTVKEWPFDQPYYIIMNLAVGGWYGGPIEDKDLPFQLEIESIKVYQQE